jgi:hypothetical protein
MLLSMVMSEGWKMGKRKDYNQLLIRIFFYSSIVLSFSSLFVMSTLTLSGKLFFAGVLTFTIAVILSKTGGV